GRRRRGGSSEPPRAAGSGFLSCPGDRKRAGPGGSSSRLPVLSPEIVCRFKELQEPLSSCCEAGASSPSVLQGNGFRGLDFDFSTSARKAALDSRRSLTSESSSSGSSG